MCSYAPVTDSFSGPGGQFMATKKSPRTKFFVTGQGHSSNYFDYVIARILDQFDYVTWIGSSRAYNAIAI